MHAMRGSWEVAERHGAGHAGATARAAHERPGPARRQTCQVATHHPFGLSRTNARLTWSGAASTCLLPMSCGTPTFPGKREATPPMGVPCRGWAYVAFVTDVSRRIVGWQTTQRPVHDLALDALEMPSDNENARELISGAWCIICDRGVQYRPRPLRTGSGLARSSSLVQGRAHPLARAPESTSTPPVVATAEWVFWVGIVRSHPLSACALPLSTKPLGLPTPTRTARNSHNRKPPEPTKPDSTKLGA